MAKATKTPPTRSANHIRLMTPPATPATPTADKAPELRPKRPIYRTYAEIIRTLMIAATARIRAVDKQPDPIPPVPTSARIRRLARSYARHRQLACKAESALSKLNLDVRDDGRVEWSYRYRNTLNEKPGVARQKRLDKLAALRVAATIDTMDLTPTRAKAYLLTLERRLAKV